MICFLDNKKAPQENIVFLGVHIARFHPNYDIKSSLIRAFNASHTAVLMLSFRTQLQSGIHFKLPKKYLQPRYFLSCRLTKNYFLLHRLYYIIALFIIKVK